MRERRLFLSYAYPPQEAPRAIQVARLVRHLEPGSVRVFCARAGDDRRLIEAIGDPDAPVEQIEWSRGSRRRLAIHRRLLRGRFEVPDGYRPWASDAARHVLTHCPPTASNTLVTFGQPMSDHLAGLRIAGRTGCHWIAHLSDPWVGNPYSEPNMTQRIRGERLERLVFERADLIVFVSQESADLCLSRHSAAIGRKGRVVPHGFDPSLFGPSPPRSRDPGGALVIRHLGSLYGARTVQPVLAAIAQIHRDDPSSLERVRIELVGQHETSIDEMPSAKALPEGILVVRPAVGYLESLELMKGADLLLSIDAPATTSPFLPSKLVEYIGSGRPIVAITPPGTAAHTVREIGGIVADPADHGQVARALSEGIRVARGAYAANGWKRGGGAAERYSARSVGDQFSECLHELERRS